MRAPLLVLAALLALTGCSSGSTSAATASPTATETGPTLLPTGKAPLPVAGDYLSPDGFVPPLTLAVPAGWVSTHRGDDAFDLSRPDPAKDAPLVVVALITPKDDVVATALTRMRLAAQGRVTPVTGSLADHPAKGFEEVGGTGELIASPSGTLSLDQTQGDHLLVLGTDVDDVPLIAVVLVPDGAQWPGQHAAAATLLKGVHAA